MRYLILFLLLSGDSFSQVPAIEWQKTYGGSLNDGANSIILTFENNYIISGFAESPDGDVLNHHNPPWGESGDAWIFSIDSLGALLWNKCYGGTGEEEAYSILETKDTNYVFCAQTSSFNGDVPPINGGPDFWIVKISRQGTIYWSNCYGGSSGDYPNSIIGTLDSGLLILGTTHSNDFDVMGFHGAYDIWAIKLINDTVIDWSNSFGGSFADAAYGLNTIVELTDGNILIAGNIASTNGNASCNHSTSLDILLLKVSSIGQVLWQKCFGGSSIDRVFSLKLSNNHIFIGGGSGSIDGDITNHFGGEDAWILKTDTQGTIIWQKCFGGSLFDDANAICPTQDGGVVFTGYSYSTSLQVPVNQGMKDVWICKADSMGNFEWGKTIGGSADEEANSIIQTSDGGFIIVGVTDSNDGDITQNHGQTDAWVVKLSPPGLSINDPEYSIMDIAVFQNGMNVNTRFFSRVNEEVNMEIYNLSGQKIAENIFRISEGINYFSLPGNYKEGSYCLKISGRDFWQSKVFVVTE